jgi:glycosyltransferase involved in cell wall biosynthesis
MLYLCIPSFNEAPTVGVLLWRIRKVFQEYSREYEVIVYDDGSTDATAETLAAYGKVLPLTVLRSEQRRGYGQALEALARDVSRRTRYPRRDAMLVLQGDFTDPPEAIPELVKRFEGGADVVIGERERGAMPVPVRRLAAVAPWVMRPFVHDPGTSDPFGAFRLYRIALVRDYLKANPDAPLVTSDGWAANLELLVKLNSFARRVEKVPVAPRYDIRPRETRVRPFADALSLYRAGRSARGWRARSGAPAQPAGAA